MKSSRSFVNTSKLPQKIHNIDRSVNFTLAQWHSEQELSIHQELLAPSKNEIEIYNPNLEQH